MPSRFVTSTFTALVLAAALAFALASHYRSTPFSFSTMAYGAIAAPRTAEPVSLPIMSFNLQNQKALTTFPLTLDTTPKELRETMFSIFEAEINSKSSLSPSQNRSSFTAQAHRSSPSLSLFLSLSLR